MAGNTIRNDLIIAMKSEILLHMLYGGKSMSIYCIIL